MTDWEYKSFQVRDLGGGAFYMTAQVRKVSPVASTEALSDWVRNPTFSFQTTAKPSK